MTSSLVAVAVILLGLFALKKNDQSGRAPRD